MKINLAVGISAIISVSAISWFSGYYAGHNQGYEDSSEASARLNFPVKYTETWEPRAGEVVVTHYDGSGTHHFGHVRTVMLTGVVNVGRDQCQTGLLVYGLGLPGVDSSWVKPAP